MFPRAAHAALMPVVLRVRVVERGASVTSANDTTGEDGRIAFVRASQVNLDLGIRPPR